jgi:hypothetical protein
LSSKSLRGAHVPASIRLGRRGSGVQIAPPRPYASVWLICNAPRHQRTALHKRQAGRYRKAAPRRYCEPAAHRIRQGKPDKRPDSGASGWAACLSKFHSRPSVPRDRLYRLPSEAPTPRAARPLLRRRGFGSPARSADRTRQAGFTIALPSQRSLPLPSTPILACGGPLSLRADDVHLQSGMLFSFPPE